VIRPETRQTKPFNPEMEPIAKLATTREAELLHLFKSNLASSAEVIILAFLARDPAFQQSEVFLDVS
jgi:hypothetical protein